MNNIQPYPVELPIHSPPSNAESQQSNSTRPTQSETTTEVGCTGVGQSLQLEKDACVATDDSGIDDTQCHSDVLITQGNSGAGPLQQRQDALAPSQVWGLYDGRTSTAVAQSQPTVSQSGQPLVHPMETPQEMPLKERIKDARFALLRLAGVDPFQLRQRNGEFFSGVVAIIERKSLENCSWRNSDEVSAAQRALDMIRVACPNLKELSGIEELRALEKLALCLAKPDPMHHPVHPMHHPMRPMQRPMPQEYMHMPRPTQSEPRPM